MSALRKFLLALASTFALLAGLSAYLWANHAGEVFAFFTGLYVGVFFLVIREVLEEFCK